MQSYYETAAKQRALAKLIRVVTNRRFIITLLHGFAAGLPLALVGSTLQAWFTVSKVDIVTIGLLGAVSWPYTVKFCWSPVLDRFEIPRLGHRRGWILLMQLLIMATLAVMAMLNPTFSPWPLGIAAFLLAFFSATQDIGIDAYRTELLPEEERGMGAALYTWGYRIAMLFSGGLALIFAAKIGWRWTYLLMALTMGISAIITVFSPRIPNPAAPPVSIDHAFIDPFVEFFNRKSVTTACLMLAFIVLYKIGDALGLSLSTTFMIRGLGFTLTDVGAIYKTVGLVATLLGALAGGSFMMRTSLYRALMQFGFLQGISTGMFMVLAIYGKSYGLMVLTIFLENFCGGLGTVALVALLMALCDARYTATQFALLSSLSAIGRVFTAPVAGVMVKHIGWAHFYGWSVVLAIPGLCLLWVIRDTIKALDHTSPAQT